MNSDLIAKEHKSFRVMYYAKNADHEYQETFHVWHGNDPNEIFNLALKFAEKEDSESNKGYRILNSENVEIINTQNRIDYCSL